MPGLSWVENWKILIIPGICVFGVITNTLNIAVFFNPKMKDPSFKYMRAIAFSDLVYLGLASYSFMEFCFDCPSYYSFQMQAYIIYVDMYASSCLAIFNVFLDIALSLQRLSIILNRKFSDKTHCCLISILFLIAFFYYSPVLVLTSVIPFSSKNGTNTSESFFRAAPNEYGNTLAGKITPIVLTAFRIFLGLIVLTLINVKNVYHLKKRFNFNLRNKFENSSTLKEEHVKTSEIRASKVDCSSSGDKPKKRVRFNETEKKSRSSRNITMMVIWIAVLYLFGMVPYLVAYSLQFIYDWSNIMENITVIAIIILFLSHGSNIFIYFSFNKMFRRILIGYIRWMGFC